MRIANSLPVLNQQLSETTMAPRLPVLNLDKINSTYMASGTDEGAGDKTGSKIDKNQNRKKNSVTHQQFSEATVAPKRTSPRNNIQPEREKEVTRKKANMERSKNGLSDFLNKQSEVSKMNIVFDIKMK